MGRRPRNWDPEAFEESRKRQRRLPIAPSQSADLSGLEGGPTSSVPQLSPQTLQMDQAAPIPSSSQGTMSTNPGASRSDPNMTALYTTACRRRDGEWIEARVVVFTGNGKIGIAKMFADDLGLFVVARPGNRIKYMREGSNRLRCDYKTEVKIGHPGGNPRDERERPAEVWTPDSSGLLSWDIRIPSNLRDRYCELRHQTITTDYANGPPVATINGPEDFYWLLEGRQHNDISNGEHCQLCLDLSMLDAIIYPP